MLSADQDGIGNAALTRRTFLKAGGMGLALSATAAGARAEAASSSSDGRAVILIMMVGGPSQLETFDPKPDAPAEVRGPFGSIATRVPGVRVSAHLPRLAQRLDRLAIVRTLYHDAAPIHETGTQLVQTGKVFPIGMESPHLGSVAARDLGVRGIAPGFVILPGPLGATGVAVPRGQSAGPLGPDFEPVFPPDVPLAGSPFDLRSEPARLRDAYGTSRFGRACLTARRLVEAGTRFVTVNMYDTVFNTVSWDCHGYGPFSRLDDYATTILPTFDQAFTALLDDLDQRGLLRSTLVLATGEFGRTPRLNESGGRDHWPKVWSGLLAGGGVRGGQTIGTTDATASEPRDRPVAVRELAATVSESIGLETAAVVPDAPSIHEAFA